MNHALLKNIPARSTVYRTMMVLATSSAAMLGCRENQRVEPRNIPIAVAEASGDGVVQLTDSDDEPIQGAYMVAYAGEPVAVTLDGAQSIDRDGRIVTYRWLSATAAPDAGGRLVPPDAEPGWPADEVQTVVTLDQGSWSFNLWVIDDADLVSDPSNVTIQVGEDMAACAPEDCPMPAFGEPCCTSEETGAMEGDPRGRAPGLCGTDLGALSAELAGVCLQLDQPGEESTECPDIMGATALEPGCCTDEGLCASINTSVPLGCHYPQLMEGETLTECTP